MGKQLSSRRTVYSSLAGIVLAAFVFSACLPKGPMPGEEGRDGKGPDEVLAAMVVAKEVPLVHSARGEIIPSNSIQLQAVANTIIAKVLVHEGQKITAGTIVIQYDTELPRLKLELARAESEEAEAAIDFEQFRFDNRDALLDEEEISPTVYDMIERRLDFERARSKRAKAEINYLQGVLKATDVVSPIAGTVITRSVADGMPVAEGQFLMEIVQDDPVKLHVRLPEEFVPATYRGQLLQVKFPGSEHGEETVKISEVGVAVDALTNTFDIFAELENPDGKLKPGMELDTTLITDKKITVIAIPKSSVALRKKKVVVFLIEDGVAKQVKLRLGRPIGNEVTVVSGVKDGDIIVVDPPKNLQDGDKVEILTAVSRKRENS